MKPIVFISNDVSQNYPNALIRAGFEVTYSDFLSADGLFIPGGGDVDARFYGKSLSYCTNVDLDLDINEMRLIDRAISKNMPIMGVCRGLQLLNVFFGGALCRDISGHGKDIDSETTCRFFGCLKDIYGDFGKVACNHHQCVEKLAEGSVVTAVSTDGVIEGFSREKIIAVQFHPERSRYPQIDGNKLYACFKGLFD